MKDRLVTIGLIQMSMEVSAEANLKKALTMIDEATGKGAQIVVLPELFLSPYFCQSKDDRSAFARAEPIPGPTTQALSDAAHRHKIVLIGGSIFEASANGKYYNTTPVFGTDGKLLGTYRKTHIPEDILYHEQHYFSPGDTGIHVFDTPFGKICPLICYDQWYPEAARIAVLKGAEIIIYPTAIGVIDASVEENITGDWEAMWRAVQVGHAAANICYIAALNRVGREGAITFWGGSFVSDPVGKILSKAGSEEGILIAQCDLSRIASLRKSWNFFACRRPETYGTITKSF